MHAQFLYTVNWLLPHPVYEISSHGHSFVISRKFLTYMILVLRGPDRVPWLMHNKGVFTGIPTCWMLVCIFAGRIVFSHFQLHGSVLEQCNSYLALADVEVEIFQLLTNKTQCVKSHLFFVCMIVVKEASIVKLPVKTALLKFIPDVLNSALP